MDTLNQLDCLIIDTPIHLVDALETVDHVYTITSLGGFEALLRGKEVTVLGKPFYQAMSESKKIKTNQVFWIVLLQYHIFKP